MGRMPLPGHKERSGPFWALASAVLSLLYRLVCGARAFLYRCGLAKRKRLHAAVISVGNITVGGTGKTPLVLYLADKLKQQNKKVAVLTRGYRRKKKGLVELSGETTSKTNWKDSGDEPYLLAQRLIDVPIIVGRRRDRAGEYAVAKFGSEILILDDGFQHWRLSRDSDIVVIDSSNPFGNGKLLPAGILREPLAALKRADLFVLTKTDQAENKAGLIARLRKHNPEAELVESVYQIRSVKNLADGSSLDIERLRNRKTLAFSGIGNPSSFENSLKQLKVRILRHRVFRDHYAYGRKDIMELIKQARALEADFIITTEKDSVRIPLVKSSEVPFYVLKIDLKITSGEETLLKRIGGLDI
jgi:tetraacyldisaccharide 4'-kinase